MTSDFRVLGSNAIAGLKEVRLYDKTWSDIKDKHSEFARELPSMTNAVGATITNPSGIYRSTTSPDDSLATELALSKARTLLRLRVMAPQFGSGQMTNKSFNVYYDRDGDVLYITYKRAISSRGIEDQPGVVWRYGNDGELLSVTVIDFNHYWFSKRDQLAGEISKKFDIPTKQARVVLDHAMDN